MLSGEIGVQCRSSAAAEREDCALDELDCEGLLCPLPVLRARKRLLTLAPGALLAVRATDGMAAIDLPHFCAEAGHAFLASEDLGAGVTRYLIRRGPDRPTAAAAE